jgi:hypothetical protein
MPPMHAILALKDGAFRTLAGKIRNLLGNYSV